MDMRILSWVIWVPNAVITLLIRGGRRVRVRRCDHRSRGRRVRGQKPRNTGGHYKLEETRKWIPATVFRKN